MYVITRSAFAALAGVSPSAITHAIRRGGLAGACIADRIDLGSNAALAYLAKRPFRCNENGDLDEEDIPEGYLTPFLYGPIGTRHPVLLAFMARRLGRVPTEQDIEAEERAAP